MVLGCDTQTSNPELKEDRQFKKISIDAETGKPWRDNGEVKKPMIIGERIPCEGGSSLIFSGKKELLFAQFGH